MATVEERKVTREEKVINALPEAYCQKMARYCLDGWTFHCFETRVVNFWTAKRGSDVLLHSSSTLLTLLDGMGRQVPDAASE